MPLAAVVLGAEEIAAAKLLYRVLTLQTGNPFLLIELGSE